MMKKNGAQMMWVLQPLRWWLKFRLCRVFLYNLKYFCISLYDPFLQSKRDHNLKKKKDKLGVVAHTCKHPSTLGGWSKRTIRGPLVSSTSAWFHTDFNASMNWVVRLILKKQTRTVTWSKDRQWLYKWLHKAVMRDFPYYIIKFAW